ncbi:hypothetical protein Taro_002510 [Colocasia esculenta]|uniref:Uncharacterized protein n=1 Tax=Colocasia esculenta TaxID=4460 RepID=A0A843TNW4_COLES|nr:hypothetical protein [Colocasia esculenta]
MEPFLSMSSTLHCDEDAEEVASSGASGAWASPPSSSPPRFSASSFYDDAHCPVADLLSAELQHAPRPGYLARLRDGSLDPAARRGAINWILKAETPSAHPPLLHSFCAGLPPSPAHDGVPRRELPRQVSLVAGTPGGYYKGSTFLRFGSSLCFHGRVNLTGVCPWRRTQKGVGWPWQLLAVACLSVAAKMEETDPPPLLDLQVLELTFVFDTQTVARMELLLMAALRWRMRPVTPFDFLGHFAGLLRPGPQRREAGPMFSRFFELLLGTQRVVEFLGYRPSAIAAAAVLCVAGDNGADVDLCSRFHDVVSKDAVEGCRRLMEQCLPDACRMSGRLKSAPAVSEPLALAPPQSPVGVLDAAACASCDSQKSAAEPTAKQRRLPAPCTESTGSSSVVGDDP